MAFAQLIYHERLRDIELCLSAQEAKLYHMGLRQEIKRSTLTDANSRETGVSMPSFSAPDRAGAHALPRRQLRHRVGEHDLRTELDDHRFVPVALSVDAVSYDHTLPDRLHGSLAVTPATLMWARLVVCLHPLREEDLPSFDVSLVVTYSHDRFRVGRWTP